MKIKFCVFSLLDGEEDTNKKKLTLESECESIKDFEDYWKKQEKNYFVSIKQINTL